jgi:predicted negative regulator of RcsB-dependent stress response
VTKTGSVKAGRRWRLRHLIGVVVLGVVLCGGGFGYEVYRQNQEGKAPTEAAEAFLNSIESNSPSDAYLQLCAATKKQYTPAQFTAYVKAQPEIDSHSAIAVQLSTVNGVRSAIVTESIKNSSGSTDSHGIVLSNEGGTWLVCGQPY